MLLTCCVVLPDDVEVPVDCEVVTGTDGTVVVDDTTAVFDTVDVGGKVTEISKMVERGAVTGTAALVVGWNWERWTFVEWHVPLGCTWGVLNCFKESGMLGLRITLEIVRVPLKRMSDMNGSSSTWKVDGSGVIDRNGNPDPVKCLK